MTPEFENAAKAVQNLSSKPENDVLLKLYALYKQATEGDVTGDKPSMFDFKAAAKYNAWNNLKGKTKQEAEKAYIALVNSLV
jgi:diazepam-binding inhibitor (GABA receptor modulator, acyl-CoA-binding protein)